MNEAAEKRVGDLVAAWEEKRQQGVELRPEELCRTHPELLLEVRKRIEALKKVAWLTPRAADDETLAGNGDAPAQPTHPFLSPPKRPGEIGRLGQYRVLKQLGQGGMGTVFLAEDINLERRVALKVIAGGQGGPQARQRFIREAQSAAAIEHDNIVTVYQVGQHQGVLFLAMQMLEGESLDDRLQREGKLPLPDVIRIARDVAQGLKAAHSKGMIHRDIKPSNLWLDSRTGRTIILDFGLARQVDAGNKVTKLGEIVGTPAYLSPEQARGEKVDHRTDLFSLGTVLYQMVTGRKPFQGADTVSLLVALVEETPPAPHTIDARLPEAVSKLIMQLLEKKADKRPADAAAVVDALSASEKTQTQIEKAASRKTVSKGPLITPRPKSNRKNTSAKALLLGGAAIAAAILAAVVIVRVSTGQAQGVLTIDTVDPDVEVVVRQGGKQVAILDKKTKQEVYLPIGEYEVELKNAKEGLSLKTRQYTLKNGERELVRVTWESASIPSLQNKDSGATTIDLLKMLHSPTNKVHNVAPDRGSATFDGTTLFISTTIADDSSFDLPYSPPSAYALTIQTKLLKGADDLRLRVPFGDNRRFFVSLSPANSSKSPNEIKVPARKERTIHCNVWGDRIMIDVDGVRVVDVTNPGFTKNTNPNTNPDRLNLGCAGQSQYQITKLEVAILHTVAYTNKLGMQFAFVPKGRSWLGGGGGKPGDQLVDIKYDFYLGTYEVTQEEWVKVMGNNPSRFSRTGSQKAAVQGIPDDELKRFPVETVSWEDAQSFVRKLNDLLSESNWQYHPIPRPTFLVV